MKVIYGPRCSGKTHELIRMANKNDQYIIVPTEREASRIYHEAYRQNLAIRTPISVSECLYRSRQPVGGVLIDDVTAILADLLHLDRIDAVTVCAREHLQLETRLPPETVELMRSMGQEVDE